MPTQAPPVWASFYFSGGEMADLKFNARVEADLSPLAQAASNMTAIMGKFAPKGLKQQYQELGRFIGEALDPTSKLKNVPVAGRVKLGAELAKGFKEAETTVNGLAKTLGSKLGPAFASVETSANKVDRAVQTMSARGLERTLRNSANEVPKISTALFKVNGAWRQISADAEAYRKKLKDQATQVGEVRQRVADLRKEYDLRVPLATNAAGLKKLSDTQERLKRAEVELTRLVTKYGSEQKTQENERARILGTINTTLSSGLSILKLTKEEEAKLTTSEKLRLVTQKQITEEQRRQTEMATRQAQIDQARRQAYALTIAGGQIFQGHVLLRIDNWYGSRKCCRAQRHDGTTYANHAGCSNYTERPRNNHQGCLRYPWSVQSTNGRCSVSN